MFGPRRGVALGARNGVVFGPRKAAVLGAHTHRVAAPREAVLLPVALRPAGEGRGGLVRVEAAGAVSVRRCAQAPEDPGRERVSRCGGRMGGGANVGGVCCDVVGEWVEGRK